MTIPENQPKESVRRAPSYMVQWCPLSDEYVDPVDAYDKISHEILRPTAFSYTREYSQHITPDRGLEEYRR